MPLQIRQNLPLLAAKNAIISADGLSQISTISANIMKREIEPRNPGLTYHPKITNKPPSSFAPPPGTIPGTSFVELPEINYDQPSNLPNPFTTPPTGVPSENNPTPQSDTKPYYCTAILELVRLPQEWLAMQGKEIPIISVMSGEGARIMGQATFYYDEKTASIYIESKTLESV